MIKRLFWEALIVAVIICLLISIFENQLRTLKVIVETRSAPEYMVRNLDELMGCSEKLGFNIERPMLRVMKKRVERIDEAGQIFYPGGIAYMDLNIIVLAEYASYETTAHELGHIIDAQTGRKGHPFFEGKGHWHVQAIADSLGAVLIRCGK